MTPEEKSAVEHFVASLGTHDPWMYTGTCVGIMNSINFDAPAELTRDGDYYTIRAAWKDGRIFEMSYRQGGWSMGFVKLEVKNE